MSAAEHQLNRLFSFLQYIADFKQAQLAMIEMALEAEPESSELLQLKADLNTLIQLTEESLAEENAKVSRDISHFYSEIL